MRVSGQALLPLFLAGVAFVLIAKLWSGTSSNDFANKPTRRAARTSATATEDASQSGAAADQALLRGRLVDARTGEPVAAGVTLFGDGGFERQAEAGTDGLFHLDSPTAVHATLAIPRTAGHFGLVQELEIPFRSPIVSLELKLEQRRELPVVLRTPDGQSLADVLPPQAPWARETWPSILITHVAPGGRVSEGAPDPLLTTRVGQFFSSVHGDVELSAGSPEGCVGFVSLFEAPPVSCSLVIGSRVLQTMVLDGQESSINFSVDPSELQATRADIALRVVDADTGLPLAARRGLWLGMLGGSATAVDAELDEDGRVEIKDAPAGSVNLFLRFGDYEHQVQRFDLHAGERNDIGELRVHAGACIAGHVVTETGEAVPARVWSSSREGRDHPLGQATETPDGADWFAICGLPRTNVLIGIDDPHWALNPVEVDLLKGSAQNQSIVARKGSSVRLVGPYSASGAARMRVLDARNLCIWVGENFEQELHELQLLPGHYTIEVLREGRPGTRQALDLGPARDATVLLR